MQIKIIERKALTNYHSNGHSLISPSWSKRWSQCPATVINLHEQRSHAKDNLESCRGTFAHLLFEVYGALNILIDDNLKPSSVLSDAQVQEVHDLNNSYTTNPSNDETVRTLAGDISQMILYDYVEPDMTLYLNQCLQHIIDLRSNGYIVQHEIACKLGWLLGHDQCDGTSDVVAYNKDTSHLIIGDLKYGVVDMVYPENNYQLNVYCLGAIHTLGLKSSDIGSITFEIYQPRVHHPLLQYHTTVDQVYNFVMDNIATQSIRALQLIGSPDVVRDSDYHPSTSNCYYCPRKLECTAYSDKAINDAKSVFDADENLKPRMAIKDFPLSRVRDVLRAEPFIKNFIKEVTKMAHDKVKQGYGDELGLKLVAGRKTRSIVGKTDDDRINAMIEIGLPREEVINIKAKSPAQLEKSLSTEHLNKVKPLIVEQIGEPLVVIESDRRKPIENPFN